MVKYRRAGTSISMGIGVVVIATLFLFGGCATKNQIRERTIDWHEGYAEGHKDGYWMGSKIKEIEEE